MTKRTAAMRVHVQVAWEKQQTREAEVRAVTCASTLVGSAVPNCLLLCHLLLPVNYLRAKVFGLPSEWRPGEGRSPTLCYIGGKLLPFELYIYSKCSIACFLPFTTKQPPGDVFFKCITFLVPILVLFLTGPQFI